MLTFYYATDTCALASHIALKDAGADYRLHRIDFATTQQRSAAYLALNPKGRVPALVTPEGILTETPAILAYVAQAYPQARLEGVEWSWPLHLLCALRCPWARVRRGDMWTADWRAYDMVYLFQRPESMERAAAKAQTEMAPGAWLVSLEFAVPGVLPSAQLRVPGGRVVWLYRMPIRRAGPQEGV